jgi:hypothetical protein
MILNGDVNRLKKKIQKFNHIYKNLMLTITIAAETIFITKIDFHAAETKKLHE